MPAREGQLGGVDEPDHPLPTEAGLRAVLTLLFGDQHLADLLVCQLHGALVIAGELEQAQVLHKALDDGDDGHTQDGPPRLADLVGGVSTWPGDIEFHPAPPPSDEEGGAGARHHPHRRPLGGGRFFKRSRLAGFQRSVTSLWRLRR